MKKVSLVLLVLFLAFGVVAPFAHAQAPDTVMVPAAINGDPYGALNKFIKGDTTSTGERNNPNRVYMLEAGKIYFLNGTLQTHFPLTLIGQKPAEGQKMAIVTSGVSPSGGTVGRFFKCFDSATFKDIYFQTCPPTGKGETFQTMQLMADSGRYVFDHCYFEWGRWLTLRIEGKHTKMYITNCYFRNLENQAGIYNGRVTDFHNNPIDTLVMVNNTEFNSNSFFLGVRNNYINYARIEHNTIANLFKWPIQWSWMTNAIISNNIFYNAHSYGEAPSDLPGQDYDGLVFGIVNVDTLPPHDADSLGYKESERVIKVNNNCWYFSKEVKDYWAAHDSVMAEPFMNSRTQAMFDDDVHYPYLEEKNTMNIDPQFKNVGDLTGFIDWMTKKRAGEKTTYWGWDPDNDRFNVQWPLPEDLSYPTTSPLYTAADGGFPVGDLNWFPDKKAEWEQWIQTGVVEGTPKNVPAEFSLRQNYPNPFNPTTSISYTLPKAGMVHIAIYNGVGQKVKTLVAKAQVAGSYTVTWSGKNDRGMQVPSGIYFCKMKAGNFSSVRKMLLLK